MMSVNLMGLKKAARDVTPQDLLGCTEGTVFGHEYTDDVAWSGSASADAGRPDYGMEFYQYFEGCYNTFNKVRFFGFFNYYDGENWIYCNERGAINEDGEMTQPVTFVVGVYEEDENGLPGKCVLKKEVDITGEQTGVQLGDESAGYTSIYAFDADLGEDIKMEHGFIQINAKDMGDSPSCWFALFVGGDGTAYQKYISDGGFFGQLPAFYCLYGDGSLNAQKALKVERFLSPTASSDKKYDKVQVEVRNIGGDEISDAMLELYLDGKLVATEPVNAAIESLETYKYTFEARVDCSGGEHEITVKNVTPGDEKTGRESLSMTVGRVSASEYEESYAIIPGEINITNVSLGTINNTTEGSEYSDFTSKKTAITPDDELALSVTVASTDYEPAVGAWIDWNGDYAFGYDEEVVFDNVTDNGDSTTTATAKITVPEGATLGDKRMRIIASTFSPSAVGGYYMGETEDYTVSVEVSPNDPLISVAESYIEETTNGEAKTRELTVSNNGNGTLNADIKYCYVLPYAPTNDYSMSKNAPARKAADKAGVKFAYKAAAKKEAPKAGAEAQYVLRYDNGYQGCIGITNYDECTYTSYYPGKMLASISGMTISSVDVYVGDIPTKGTSIVIYGQDKQSAWGTLLAEKTFTPTEYSWNHVELDAPVEISNTDLWVGVKMSGFEADKYYIGIDNGPAVEGFGDIINIEGSSWWSMADLGLDYNYCIRANVTGTPTAAISWLSLDKEQMEVAAGQSGKVNVTLSPQGLDKGLYEAYVEISSNDKFTPTVKIPVYMINGTVTGISLNENGNANVRINGGNLTVSGDKEIASVAVYDLNGQTVKNAKAAGKQATISLNGLAKGVYIIKVAFADGSASTVKVPVLK